MEKLLDMVASILTNATLFSAIVGAGSASTGGIYQPKTPVSLLK